MYISKITGSTTFCILMFSESRVLVGAGTIIKTPNGFMAASKV